MDAIDLEPEMSQTGSPAPSRNHRATPARRPVGLKVIAVLVALCTLSVLSQILHPPMAFNYDHPPTMVEIQLTIVALGVVTAWLTWDDNPWKSRLFAVLSVFILLSTFFDQFVVQRLLQRAEESRWGVNRPFWPWTELCFYKFACQVQMLGLGFWYLRRLDRDSPAGP